MGKSSTQSTDTETGIEWQAPFLPGVNQWPDRPELVECVAKYPDYKHNGKTLWSTDEALCFEVLERRIVRNQGKKKIARECRVSKWSVDAIVDRADELGILAPYKERVSKQWGHIVEEAQEEIRERLADGSMPANVLPIVAGVASDKKKDLDAASGLQLLPVGPLLNVEQVNLFFTLPPVEKSSTGMKVIQPANASAQALRPSVGARSPLPTALVEADLADAKGGGGGLETRAGRADTDGSQSGPQDAKGASTPDSDSP